jgi:hypothetical protein
MIEERYFRLVTRDKMTSELQRTVGGEYRPTINTALPKKLAYSGITFEGSLVTDSQIEKREYRLKEVIHAEILVYEEV